MDRTLLNGDRLADPITPHRGMTAASHPSVAADQACTCGAPASAGERGIRERIAQELDALALRIVRYIDYRDECIKMNSRHGVIDAECDLREFEAQVAVLRKVLG